MDDKKHISEWTKLKKDWITNEKIDQEELLTESEYDEAISTWRKMGVAEDYRHQDGCYSRTCKPYFAWCRCQQ